MQNDWLKLSSSQNITEISDLLNIAIVTSHFSIFYIISVNIISENYPAISKDFF